MTVQNDFLPFAVGAGANVLTQAQYAALSAVATGYQSGVAQSAAVNKSLRQSSIMAAVISSFIVAQTGQAAIDDGTTATLLANFTQAVVIASKQRVILADTGTANAYAAANTVPLTALPTASGVVQTVQIAHANTGASTYAPDGLTAKPIYGLGGAALQGGELPANGIATLVSYVGPLLNGGNLCWVLYECIGGAQQVPPATKSNHAVNLGQFETIAQYSVTQTGTLGNPISVTTYTPTNQVITFPSFSKTGAFRVVAQLVASIFSTAANVEGQFQNALYDGTTVVGSGGNWSIYKKNSGYGGQTADTFISSTTYAPGATVTFTQRVVVPVLEDTQFSIQSCFMRLSVIEA